MSFAFISYNHRDRDLASQLVGFLQKNNLRCFIDYRDLPKNAEWDEGIPPAIKNCDAVIFIVSCNFMQSEQVKKEVRLAINEYKKTCIVFRLDETPYPDNSLSYHMSAANCIMALQNPQSYFPDVLTELRKSVTTEALKQDDFIANENKITRLDKYTGTDFEVVVPDYFKSIGFGAFHNSKITKAVIPETVTEIGEMAFKSAVNLISVTLPATVKRIGKNAFSGTKLACGGEVVIGGAYIKAEPNAEKIKLGDEILCIADGAFEGCAHLNGVELNKELKYIGAGAFRGCVKLNTLKISKGVEYIGRNAFFDCGIKSVSVYPPTPPDVEDELFDKEVKVEIKGNKEAYQSHPFWKKYL